MRPDEEHILLKERVDDGIHTREKEERTTENKMERWVPMGHEKYWTENGREDGQGDRATWSRKIISHTSDHIFI